VMDKLGGGSPMRDASQDAYHVTNVRIRTVDAEVDVIRRNDMGDPELLTLTFKQNLLKGYMVQDVRVWRYEVDEPPPYYVPETMRAGQPVRGAAGDE
ncbi:MAG: hypothetical protein HKO59_03195, partial [Phycisphaerales bacterium]|nr:hypothetical protein [Phycisphaerae bacterium]NNM24987.1 hypothetical protein [Phycisphaerales bacterium]